MAYEIKLDIFEGPLDLLLFLIKKNEVDICDIPIAVITEQYLEHIRIMKSLNFDVAGEYLVIASTLIHIKSKMLLPVHEDEEEEEDPRAELAKQLLEYQIFKEAAINFDNMKLLGRDVFGRGLIVENKVCEDKWTIGEISIFELVEAFRKTISGMVKKELMEIDTERISLSDRINEIISRLGESEVLTFADLLRDSGDKTGIVYTFLAILELVKLRIVRAYQAIPHGPIRICLSVESK